MESFQQQRTKEILRNWEKDILEKNNTPVLLITLNANYDWEFVSLINDKKQLKIILTKVLNGIDKSILLEQ